MKGGSEAADICPCRQWRPRGWAHRSAVGAPRPSTPGDRGRTRSPPTPRSSSMSHSSSSPRSICDRALRATWVEYSHAYRIDRYIYVYVRSIRSLQNKFPGMSLSLNTSTAATYSQRSFEFVLPTDIAHMLEDFQANYRP